MNRGFATPFVLLLLAGAGFGFRPLAAAGEAPKSEGRPTNAAPRERVKTEPAAAKTAGNSSAVGGTDAAGTLVVRSDGTASDGSGAYVLRYQLKDEKDASTDKKDAGGTTGDREIMVWWLTPAGRKTSIPLRWVDGPVWAARVEIKAEPGAHRLTVLVLHPAADPAAGPGVKAVSEQTYALDLPQGTLQPDTNQWFNSSDKAPEEDLEAKGGGGVGAKVTDKTTTQSATRESGAGLARSVSRFGQFSIYVIFFLFILFNLLLLLAGVIIFGIRRYLPHPLQAWLDGFPRPAREQAVTRQQLTQAGLLEAESGRAAALVEEQASASPAPLPANNLSARLMEPEAIGSLPANPFELTANDNLVSNFVAAPLALPVEAQTSLEPPPNMAVAETVIEEQSAIAEQPAVVPPVDERPETVAEQPLVAAQPAEPIVKKKVASRAVENDLDDLLLTPELLAMVEGKEKTVANESAPAPMAEPQTKPDQDNNVLTPELLAMLQMEEDRDSAPPPAENIKAPEEALEKTPDKTIPLHFEPAAANKPEGLSSDEMMSSLQRMLDQLQNQPAAPLAPELANEQTTDPAELEMLNSIFGQAKLPELGVGMAFGDDGPEEDPEYQPEPPDQPGETGKPEGLSADEMNNSLKRMLDQIHNQQEPDPGPPPAGDPAPTSAEQAMIDSLLERVTLPELGVGMAFGDDGPEEDPEYQPEPPAEVSKPEGLSADELTGSLQRMLDQLHSQPAPELADEQTTDPAELEMLNSILGRVTLPALAPGMAFGDDGPEEDPEYQPT